MCCLPPHPPPPPPPPTALLIIQHISGFHFLLINFEPEFDLAGEGGVGGWVCGCSPLCHLAIVLQHLPAPLLLSKATGTGSEAKQQPARNMNLLITSPSALICILAMSPFFSFFLSFSLETHTHTHNTAAPFFPPRCVTVCECVSVCECVCV